MEKPAFCHLFPGEKLLPGNSAIENVTFLGWWISPELKGLRWWPPTFGDEVWSRLESSPGKACLPRLLFQFLSTRCRSGEKKIPSYEGMKVLKNQFPNIVSLSGKGRHITCTQRIWITGTDGSLVPLDDLIYKYVHSIWWQCLRNHLISCMNLFQGTYLYKWSLIRPATPNWKKKQRSRVATKAGNDFYHVLGMCFAVLNAMILAHGKEKLLISLVLFAHLDLRHQTGIIYHLGMWMVSHQPAKHQLNMGRVVPLVN